MILKRIYRKLRSIAGYMYRRLKYGRVGLCGAYLQAEKNVVNKVPYIDRLYTKRERLKIFKQGFTSDKYIWYDFAKFDKKDYISDYEHYTLTEFIDWHQYYVANDKLVCERMLAPFCNIVPSIGYVFGGGTIHLVMNRLRFIN